MIERTTTMELQRTRTTNMLTARSYPSSKVVLLLITALCACARADEEARAPGAATIAVDTVAANTNNVSVLSNPDTAGWTAGLTAKPGDSMATLLEVRTARHDEFERIVFVFGPEGIPGFKVEYVDRPVRQCGSGEVVDLPGDAWLLVRLEPARAHTEEGKATVTQRDRALGYENMKRLKLICDFEAIVEWVAAVGYPGKYRTLELRDPARLVIDVRK